MAFAMAGVVYLPSNGPRIFLSIRGEVTPLLIVNSSPILTNLPVKPLLAASSGVSKNIFPVPILFNSLYNLVLETKLANSIPVSNTLCLTSSTRPYIFCTTSGTVSPLFNKLPTNLSPPDNCICVCSNNLATLRPSLEA